MDYSKAIQKAIDYIEANLTAEVNLESIAREVHVSMYHFARMFNSATGDTLGAYIRTRRLTQASHELVDTSSSIIDIAIKYQFGSQEAFTRAFKSQFKLAPARFRENGNNLVMYEKRRLSIEAINYFLDQQIMQKPQIIAKPAFKVVGMKVTTTLNENIAKGTIPNLWTKFLPHMANIPNRINEKISYGICAGDSFDIDNHTRDSDYDYIAGVEVESFDDVPEGMITREVPERKYAVFTHRGPLSNLKFTLDYIYGPWAQKSDYKIVQGDDFEQYDDRFIPAGDDSELDIYIPIE